MELEFSAPGRVNLLGEHTDYTGGLVLPMAIPFHTTAAIFPRDDGRYRFTSAQFEQTREISANDRSAAVNDWSDYPVGVLRQLQERGIEPPPFTLHVRGNVPLNSGLSSSASIEVASATAILAHAGVALPVEEIALLCQRAENVYVQSPCGIMDQFVITAAKAKHALLLNTRSLTYEHIPITAGELANTRIVVCNSMVKHSIAGGDYGDRRRELEAGQVVVLKIFPELRDLGDATLGQLEACKDRMLETSFRRCRHVITENERVREATQVLRAGDPVRFGELMLAGHASERDDFECSVPEVDFLVETAASVPGCFGARLTGGGFGGCTVNLVKQDEADTLSETLKSAYQRRFGVHAETYLCEAVDGAVLGNARHGETNR